MKLPSIIKLSWVAAAAVASGVARASPYCADAPRSEWQDPIAFQQKLRDQGMRVDDFEITRGGCYKVAGWDKEKRRIKQYYNAKTAELVRSRMDRDWDDSDDYRGYDHDWGGMGRRHDGMMRRRDDR